MSVRYIHKGEPTTELAEIVPLESAKATGVYKAVKQGIAAVKREDGPSPIGANFDGASVMFGEKSGVKALLKKDFPIINVIQCVAHKHELSVLDAEKSMPYLQIFEETIKSIFNFYHFSTKRRRELAEIADLLSTMLTNYSSVEAVRWVTSKSRALLAVKKNFALTVMHTEDASQGSKDAKTKTKAASIHREITTVPFVKMLHSMLDLIDIITETSKIFQLEKLTILEVPDIIQETTMKLMNLKQHIAKHSKEFYDNLTASKRSGDQKSSARVQPLQRTKKTTTSRNCWKMQSLTSSHDLRILRKLLLSILRFLTSSFGHEKKNSWHVLVETMFNA